MDIMEKQGRLLADRPRLIAGGEMFTGGNAISFIDGDKWRRMRRFVVRGNGMPLSYFAMRRRALHTHLQPKAAEAYQPLQMSHAKNTVLGLLEDPHNFQKHAST